MLLFPGGVTPSRVQCRGPFLSQATGPLRGGILGRFRLVLEVVSLDSTLGDGVCFAKSLGKAMYTPRRRFARRGVYSFVLGVS